MLNTCMRLIMSFSYHLNRNNSTKCLNDLVESDAGARFYRVFLRNTAKPCVHIRCFSKKKVLDSIYESKTALKMIKLNKKSHFHIDVKAIHFAKYVHFYVRIYMVESDSEINASPYMMFVCLTSSKELNNYDVVLRHTCLVALID